ncbi:MAG: DMT family transporter [Chloroflexota bacterium]
MLTYLFVITRIFANPLSNVFQKKLTSRSTDPLFVILVTHILLSLTILPVLYFLYPIQLSGDFWFNISVCAVLAIAGNTLIVAALQSTDLSVLGPINAYKSIVSMLLGMLMLGEFPTLLGVVGMLMILSGSYFVIEKEAGTSNKNFLGQFLSNKGIQLRFAALIFSATEAIFLKKALLLSSPLITFVFWCILGVPIAALAVSVGRRGKIQEQLANLRQKASGFALLTLTTGLMQLSTLYTFGVLQVGYSLALFQTSTLLSVLFGYHFFQEKNIMRRLLGALIMILGAVLIVSFGSRR